MQQTEPISEVLEARVEPAVELGRRCVVVDTTFATRLRTRHSRRFEASIVAPDETFTRNVPNVGDDELASLDESGLAIVGAAVRPGVLLVGKTEPCGAGPASPEEKLLRAIFGEGAGKTRDVSLRAPPGQHGPVVRDADRLTSRVRSSVARSAAPGTQQKEGAGLDPAPLVVDFSWVLRRASFLCRPSCP